MIAINLQDATAPPPGLPITPHVVEVEIQDGAFETRWHRM